MISQKPGQKLIATARNVEDLFYLNASENILKVRLDVTDVKSVDAVFAAAKEHFGERFYLDVVVCSFFPSPARIISKRVQKPRG